MHTVCITSVRQNERYQDDNSDFPLYQYHSTLGVIIGGRQQLAVAWPDITFCLP